GPCRVKLTQYFGRPRGGDQSHPRPDEGLVEGYVVIGEGFYLLERWRLVRVIQIFHLAFLETHLELGLVTVWVAGRVVYLHLVEPGSKVVKLTDALEDRPVLQPCNLGRNENPQMTHVRIEQI